MGKYAIKDIKSIIINGKEYPYKYYNFEQALEEIRGGMGSYESDDKQLFRNKEDKKEVD